MSLAAPTPKPNDQHAAGRVQRLLTTVIITAILAAVALLMEAVTEASASSESVRHLAARLFAPYNGYLYSHGAEARAASERLLVVDIGQQTLSRLRATWPLAYGQHARLLERIRQAQPKAVFIDFQFQAEREDPSIAQLRDTLCAMQADGIAVYLAAGNDAAGGQLRPDLEALAGHRQPPCFSKVAVSYEPSPVDRIAWTYPLQAHVGEQTLPSAALALARSLRGDTVADGHEPQTMGLVWGASDRPSGPRWLAEAAATEGTAAAPAPAHYCRGPSWKDLVPLQAFLARVSGFEPDHRPQCPQQTSLDAASLITAKTPEAAQAQTDLIRGRAVLYGGSFDANDFVTSPLQGDIPGVYLHAQAADNLLRFGPDWRHAELTGEHELGYAGELAVTFVCMWAVLLAFFAGRGVLKWVWTVLPPTRWLGGRIDRIQGWLTAQAHAAQARQRPSLGLLLTLLPKELGGLLGRLGKFYLALLLAVPLSLALEHWGHVAVIGYSSLLAFCILGDLFETAAHGQHDEAHGHAATTSTSDTPSTSQEPTC